MNPPASVADDPGWPRLIAGRRGSLQVHSQLMQVCQAGQSQLIPVETRLYCRSGPFQLQVATSRVLFDRSEYLGGFINGVLVSLGVAEKNIRCASSTTGTVKKLDEGQANRLAEILTGLLHPIVKQSHKRLLNQALVMKQMQGAKENRNV
ncbi:TPA: hypothetical protein ACXJQH_005935 [Pseudomonas aeruginosa]